MRLDAALAPVVNPIKHTSTCSFLSSFERQHGYKVPANQAEIGFAEMYRAAHFQACEERRQLQVGNLVEPDSLIQHNIVCNIAKQSILS